MIFNTNAKNITEEQITSTWNDQGVVVSICCSTYNQVNYLEDALRGFLSQVTTFPFEIIIRDDASTDGTTEIVREYERRYPKIIRTLVEKENQFNKGVRSIHVWPSLVKGEFVAFCEGDDFWIDPCKLQKQVDLLRQHPSAVMAVARTNHYRQECDHAVLVDTHGICEEAHLISFAEINRYYFHTSSYLARREALCDVINRYFIGHTLFTDTSLRYILITYGSFVVLPEVVSVYRDTGQGIWTSLDYENQMKWEAAAAKKLAMILSGVDSVNQKQRRYRILKKYYKFLVDDGRYIDAFMLRPYLIYYRQLRKFFWKKLYI